MSAKKVNNKLKKSASTKRNFGTKRPPAKPPKKAGKGKKS
ncbi:hypothetical protein ABHD89_001097 [Salinicoccus halitifaciens]|uniref:30S ribosomal protein THX n=1 Tax=Salinicoccus halitifaciens TaxID=1073415 RepID=A0ABV2E9F1_9STAP